MTNTATTLDVRRPTDRAAVISVTGELTAASERALMEAYHGASTPETRTIVLDFSGLDYMNSTGIGLLVTLLVRAQRQRQQLTAFGLNEHYRQILSLTRIDEAIRVCASEEEALAPIQA